MAKLKMVVKVSMNYNKCRSKALKIAVGLRGVESVALTGSQRSQVCSGKPSIIFLMARCLIKCARVESEALTGSEWSQMEITGEGVDAAQLTVLLRKMVGYAVLVSIEEATGRITRRISRSKLLGGRVTYN